MLFENMSKKFQKFPRCRLQNNSVWKDKNPFLALAKNRQLYFRSLIVTNDLSWKCKGIFTPFIYMCVCVCVCRCDYMQLHSLLVDPLEVKIASTPTTCLKELLNTHCFYLELVTILVLASTKGPGRTLPTF